MAYDYDSTEGAENTTIVIELLDKNYVVRATKTFTPAMGNIVKSFSFSTTMPTDGFYIRLKINKTKMNDQYVTCGSYKWTIDKVNEFLLPLYDLKLQMPSYSYTSSGVVKVFQGYANFVATDGSTNAYTIE